MMDLLEAYDKYLPLALDKVEDYYKQQAQYKEDNELYEQYLEEHLKRAKDDNKAQKHGETLTKENLVAAEEDRYAYELMLRSIVQKVMKDMTMEEIEEAWNDRKYASLEEQLVDELEAALSKRVFAEQSTEMPEFIYRGIGGSAVDRINGFATKDEDSILTEGFKAMLNNARIDPDEKFEKLLFVTTEPSVAAPYARETRFERIGVSPTNYGDTIYRIRTQGLDPTKFVVDDTATVGEALYGPQYIYTDDLPQEMLEITDTAGNTRQVPRIERKPYPSDENCKDVYFPNHLIDAVKKRF